MWDFFSFRGWNTESNSREQREIGALEYPQRVALKSATSLSMLHLATHVCLCVRVCVCGVSRHPTSLILCHLYVNTTLQPSNLNTQRRLNRHRLSGERQAGLHQVGPCVQRREDTCPAVPLKTRTACMLGWGYRAASPGPEVARTHIFICSSYRCCK